MAPPYALADGWLPAEILSIILVYVNLTSTLTFKESLLCCKAWHDAALPLLYRHILLTALNLDAFQRTFNIAHAPLV